MLIQFELKTPTKLLSKKEIYLLFLQIEKNKYFFYVRKNKAIAKSCSVKKQKNL